MSLPPPSDLWNSYEQELLARAPFDWKNAECIGHYGYGNGCYAKEGRARANATGQQIPAACSRCGVNQECWSRHKQKAAEVLPALTEAFEEMAREVQGPELIICWQEKMRQPDDPPDRYLPDPYTALMLLHMRVGLEHEYAGHGA